VGGDGVPRLLRPDHFARVGGRRVEFASDYLLPFLRRYAREIRAVDPEAILFFEGSPRHRAPRWNSGEIPNAAHAGHWYDGFTLLTKRYVSFLGAEFDTGRLVFGRKRVQRSFAQQLARIKAEAAERMGGVPTLIGEFGIPFDLHEKEAYRTGDFSLQAQAMDATFRALEANLLSGTLWNYTADNENCRGDQWNGEDFSIFSRDQQADPHVLSSGGRALEAVVRPYARKVAGEPLEMAFDYKRRRFEFAFRHDPAVLAPTEVFVPNWQYGDGCEVEVSDGEFEIDRDAQTLFYRHSQERSVHRIHVRPSKERS
jgi:hypothetical protein